MADIGPHSRIQRRDVIRQLTRQRLRMEKRKQLIDLRRFGWARLGPEEQFLDPFAIRETELLQALLGPSAGLLLNKGILDI